MSARLGTGDLAILIVAGVATAALTALAFFIAPVDSTPDVPGSSYSTEPDGARAAYLVLAELGHDLARSFEPIASLQATPPDTILVLVNPVERPSKGDQQAVRAFVERGGIVVAFGLSAGAFLPGVTHIDRRRLEQPLEAFPAAMPGRLTRGTRELSARRSPLPSLDRAYGPVYGTGDNLAVVTARYGQGTVLWCLDETVVQNDGVGRAANVNLLVNAADAPGARTIAWDEYYHGQRRSFWSYVARTPLIWGGAQLLLLALVLVAASSRRRGPVRARVVRPRTSPLEFIDTMASLYERAGDARAAVAATRERFRRRLAVVAGAPTSTSDEQLVAIAAPRIGVDPERARAALTASAGALRDGRVNTWDAVALVAEMQDLASVTVAGAAPRDGRQGDIPRKTARRGKPESKRMES